MRVPRIDEHRTGTAFDDEIKGRYLRSLSDMQGLGCSDGFLSNREGTMSLTQAMDTNGGWRVGYFLVVLSSTTHAPVTEDKIKQADM